MTQENATSSELTVPALTFGEKAVGLTFNPSADPMVESIKRNERIRLDKDKSEQKAMLTLAIRDLQTSQMWAVKAVTWRF